MILPRNENTSSEIIRGFSTRQNQSCYTSLGATSHEKEHLVDILSYMDTPKCHISIFEDSFSIN